ncbi:hypothetical protein ACIPUC_25505 [Streptomyces sp. LARHCF249]
MANTRVVTVGAPDDLGWRKVLIDGRPVGRVWSEKELKKLLSREGVPDGHPLRWIGADSNVWPEDPAWMRRTTGFCVAAGLFLTAWPLWEIGWADSGDALTYGGRIAGATIVIVAVVEAIAGVAAVDFWEIRRWRHSGAVVLVGVLIALFCSISVLLLQIGERFTEYTVMGIALVVWSSAALLELVICRAGKGLRIPRKLAIGVIISTLLAAANLAYSQVYVPYVRTPLIQSGAQFTESNIEKPGAPMYVTVHMYVKNAGEVPVYVLASIFWIHGAPASPPDVQMADNKLIYDGEFVQPAGRVLNPGEEVAQDAVVAIDAPAVRGYEALRAQTEVYVIRKDRMMMTNDYERSKLEGPSLEKRREEGDPPNAKSRYRTEISNSSEILNVTRGPRVITVWKLGGGEWPHIKVDVSPPGEQITFDPNLPYANEEAEERYGLTQVRGATAQTPYKELLEKARSTQRAASPAPN